jgi:hypothetical protein
MIEHTTGGARMLPAPVPARGNRGGSIAAMAGIGMIAATAWTIRHGTVELPGRASPVDQEKAAFDALFADARKRPVHHPA